MALAFLTEAASNVVKSQGYQHTIASQGVASGPIQVLPSPTAPFHTVRKTQKREERYGHRAIDCSAKV